MRINQVGRSRVVDSLWTPCFCVYMTDAQYNHLVPFLCVSCFAEPPRKCFSIKSGRTVYTRCGVDVHNSCFVDEWAFLTAEKDVSNKIRKRSGMDQLRCRILLGVILRFEKDCTVLEEVADTIWASPKVYRVLNHRNYFETMNLKLSEVFIRETLTVDEVL